MYSPPVEFSNFNSILKDNTPTWCILQPKWKAKQSLSPIFYKWEKEKADRLSDLTKANNEQSQDLNVVLQAPND